MDVLANKNFGLAENLVQTMEFSNLEIISQQNSKENTKKMPTGKLWKIK